MPRWGEIFGGALSGAGGLMSELAMRRMQEDQQRQLQEDRLASDRVTRNVDMFSKGFTQEDVDAFNAGQLPSPDLNRQVARAMAGATGGGTRVPTPLDIDIAARQFIPGFGEGVPGGGPPVDLSNAVQQLMTAPEVLEEQRLAQGPTQFIEQVVPQRDVIEGDFPPGGGPPELLSIENQQPMLEAQLVNMLTGEAVGEGRPIERSLLDQGARASFLAEAETTGRFRGEAPFIEPRAQAQARGSTLGAAEAGLDPTVFRSIELEHLARLTPSIMAATEQLQSMLRQSDFDVDLNPNNVIRQLGLEGQQAEIQRAAGTPTQAELESAGEFVGAIEQHGKALALEDGGVALPRTLIGLITRNPLGWMSQVARMDLTEEQLLYLHAAQSLVTDVVFNKSGAAVRDEEFGSFLDQMFMVGDNDPALVESKRIRRIALVAALGIASGRGGREAGTELADMIADGRLTQELVMTINMSNNPQMQRGFDARAAELGLFEFEQGDDGTAR